MCTKASNIADGVHHSFVVSSKAEKELYYWRKHPNLHGWMEKLYNQNGGTGMFNGVNLLLTPQDLDDFEQAVQNNALPHTTGFFFGATMGDEDNATFVQMARKAIAKGYAVYYTSSW